MEILYDKTFDDLTFFASSCSADISSAYMKYNVKDVKVIDYHVQVL